MHKSNPVMMIISRVSLRLILDFVSNSYVILYKLSVEDHKQVAPPNVFMHWNHKCFGSSLIMVCRQITQQAEM
jgi:hypothetical protein